MRIPGKVLQKLGIKDLEKCNKRENEQETVQDFGNCSDSFIEVIERFN